MKFGDLKGSEVGSKTYYFPKICKRYSFLVNFGTLSKIFNVILSNILNFAVLKNISIFLA